MREAHAIAYLRQMARVVRGVRQEVSRCAAEDASRKRRAAVRAPSQPGAAIGARASLQPSGA